MESFTTRPKSSGVQVGWADWEELQVFSSEVERFAQGELSADQFKGIRLRQGIYGQRQPDRYMVRVKVPGGRLTANQMDALGQLAAQFADGQAHVTTRQDLQLHYVKLRDIVPLLRLLATVGLTTREACGNCVRNVTACPLVGLCQREEFDVVPHTQNTARALLRNPRTQQLPRKFKIAFSGCAEDCALAAINDIGLLARTECSDSQVRHGFRLLVGGGLGNWPRPALPLTDFVSEEELQAWVEAIVEVFDQYGNRRDRNRARLKFVLAEKGLEWFRDQVYARVREHGGTVPGIAAEPSSAPPADPKTGKTSASAADLVQISTKEGNANDFSRWLETNVWPQKQPGQLAVWVTLSLGALLEDQFTSLANLARKHGDGTLRTAPTQNVILPSIAQAKLPDVYDELKRVRLALPGALEISDVTSCPGAETCNLGLTRSRALAEELSQRLRAEEDPDTRRIHVKISGCPNSCGHHHVADIGLHGLSRKVEGQDGPFYQLLLGGSIRQGASQFAKRIAVLPARRVPEAVVRLLAFYGHARQPGESFQAFTSRMKPEEFRKLLEDLSRVVAADSAILRDWGQQETYSVQIGRGECAS